MAGVGQLGTWKEKPLGDHGDHQVALWRSLRSDELLQAELADQRQHGLDVAVRERACGAEGRGRGDECLTLE